MAEKDEIQKEPLFIDGESAVKAVRGLKPKEPRPVLNQTVFSLQEHLGLVSKEATDSAEAVAGMAIIALAELQIRTQVKPEMVDKTLTSLFTVQHSETPTATFNRLLDFVVQHNNPRT